ncbi:MAG: exo-beta-N-acetylmuramidase NamZ domain-containing protein [Pirellulaceae bacterium]
MKPRLPSAARIAVICLALQTSPVSAGLPQANPDRCGMRSKLLQRIDVVVNEGIQAGEMPGAVVCVGRNGKIVFLKAYGDRQVEPAKVAMTTDALFDLASITKPVATATSVMLLVERGQVRLREKVSKYIPEFAQNDKGGITVLDLLIHQGGLVPDNALQDYADGPDKAFERIYALECYVEPGTKFVYTDVGFLLLADIIQRVTGQSVHEFSQANLFQPLGMKDTGYLPNDERKLLATPTEQREGRWMQGEVHDPRAYRLGGVAGHAGLFSTAEDLATYAQMMLNGGQFDGVRVLGPATVGTMTASYAVSSGVRGLGWDKGTGYSSNRGELFSKRAFGHGGFTGTAIWIDPQLDLFVIFLSSRLHPDGKGSVNALAGRVGTIAAAAIRDLPRENRLSQIPRMLGGDSLTALDRQRPKTRTLHYADSSGDGPRAALPDEETPRTDEVLTGIDVLQREGFRRFKGQRVGLITNHTGINRDGKTTVSILHAAPEVKLAALFSPEHGFEGSLDQRIVNDAREPTTGLTIFSLYGSTRKPTEESLQNLDLLMFDIQDIGTRFYTYVSTMGLAMQAAAEKEMKFVVLDRPNPINAVDVAGPMLEVGSESFVGFHPLPVRHGMTVGELATMFNEEMQLGLDLEVVRVEGWRRSDFFDATGLLWVNPSPNMRCLTQALLYPGIGLLETTNLSVGRGTDTPFEILGAPWLDGRKLAARLNHLDLAGGRFVPIRFTPDASKYADELCGGVNIIITNRDEFCPLRTGLEIARQLRLMYPDDWKVASYSRLLANEPILQAVTDGKTVAEMEAMNAAGLEAFQKRRSRFLLYK